MGRSNWIDFFAFIIVSISITLVLFNGSFEQGMCFDEVFRINNIIPFINPAAEPYDDSIYSIKLFDYKIPLMYKAYISSAGLILALPLALFDNYLIGLRTLYIIYFLLSIFIFYIVARKFIGSFYAFIVSMLILTSPLFFPEVRVGFAHSHHIAALAISFYLFYLYILSKKLRYLFSASFVLFFYANMLFYFMWTIAGVFIASIILFPNYWKDIIKSAGAIFALISGAFLGCINYVIYNISEGFPTLKPLIYRLFLPEKYQPIDFRNLPPLSEDVKIKLFTIFPSFFDKFGAFYLAIIVITTAIYAILIIYLIKKKQASKYKKAYFAILAFWLILIFILITPNTTRAGHYVYLCPFLELSLVSLAFILKDFSRNSCKNVKIKIRLPNLFVVLILSIVLVNFYVSYKEVEEINRTKGTGYFSPAIFELNEYILNNKIHSEDIIFLEWGTYAQLYFLNKGQFKINSLVFQLIAQPEDVRFKYFEYIFLKASLNNKSKLYIPIYAQCPAPHRTHIMCVGSEFNKFLEKCLNKTPKKQVFYERDGREILYLFEFSKEDIETIVNPNKIPPSRNEIPLYKPSKSKIFSQQTKIVALTRIGKDIKITLYEHPITNENVSILAFENITIPQNAKLKFSIALDPAVWDTNKGDGVVFEVSIEHNGEKDKIFSKYIDPKNNPEERKWNDFEIDLSKYGGKNVTIILSTLPGPKNDGRWDWAYWGDLRLSS